MTAPIWVLYLRDERGFSMTQITFLEVPLFLLIVFAEVPTGAVADRYGRRISLVLASAILAVSMYVYGVADNYALILVSNLAWALAFTFRSGADTAMLYDSLSALGRAGEFQRIIGRLSPLRSAAALGGLLLGAPIAAATSYSFAIVLTAAIVAAAIGVAFFMHEEPREGVAESAENVPKRSYVGTLSAGIREVFDKPVLRTLFVFSAVTAAAAAGPLQLLQQPWLTAHQVATSKLGLLQAGTRCRRALRAHGGGTAGAARPSVRIHDPASGLVPVLRTPRHRRPPFRRSRVPRDRIHGRPPRATAVRRDESPDRKRTPSDRALGQPDVQQRADGGALAARRCLRRRRRTAAGLPRVCVGRARARRLEPAGLGSR
jgi:MFS family permease